MIYSYTSEVNAWWLFWWTRRQS